MAKLKLEGLTKNFGDLCAVNNMTLEVADGEFVVMLGPSGAGKTTTLKMIAGVENPTSGKVYIGDRLVNTVEPHKRNVAMAFESYALYPHKTVRENLAYPLKSPANRLPDAEIERRVTSVAETLNIQMLLNRLPQHLSNGQKQRVALGRAMVREPEVLLLDEPISHLDAKLRHRMRQEFKALEADIRYTTIYVTHDYLEALSLGDRLVVLNQGVIQQIGLPHEVFENPVNIFVSKILGHPQINLVDCTAQNTNGVAQLISADGTVRVDLTDSMRQAIEKQNAQHYTMGIRPMHMHVVEAGAQDAVQPNTCSGVVYVFERLGNKGVLTATVGQQHFDLLTPIEMDFAIDDAVRIAIEADKVMVFNSDTQQNILFAA
ncbi:MAG: ABC transporter ATP-binding protein [Anaerolineales bacterium]|nr:ABC transporter ATP-binding protein [Anaerolineales bacterium]